MGPHAPSAGTLDHEVDQVTQSIVFIQRQYPCDARVHPQRRLPSGGAGCEGSGSSPLCRRAALLACGAEGKLGLLDPGPTLRANSTNPALCSDPSQGDLPVRTHSAGAHLAAVMLLANWTERGVTPNFRGSHRDRSRAGQPPPSPTGPEDPCWSLEVPTADSESNGAGGFEPCEQGMPRSLSAPSPGLAPLALGPGLAPSGPPGALFFTFTGFFLVSGIYDLDPTVHTAVSAPLLVTP